MWSVQQVQGTVVKFVSKMATQTKRILFRHCFLRIDDKDRSDFSLISKLQAQRGGSSKA